MSIRFVLLCSFLAACGGGTTGDDDDSSGSGEVACMYPPGTHGTGTSCAQYHSATSGQESAIKSACTQASGSVVTTCSTTNLLGCCTMMSGGFDVATCSYSDDGTTASQEMGGCTTAGGTWSTTP